MGCIVINLTAASHKLSQADKGVLNFVTAKRIGAQAQPRLSALFSGAQVRVAPLCKRARIACIVSVLQLQLCRLACSVTPLNVGLMLTLLARCTYVPRCSLCELQLHSFSAPCLSLCRKPEPRAPGSMRRSWPPATPTSGSEFARARKPGCDAAASQLTLFV